MSYLKFKEDVVFLVRIQTDQPKMYLPDPTKYIIKLFFRFFNTINEYPVWVVYE